MQRAGERFLLSATDLVGHLSCAHLTELDRAVATGALERPHFHDAELELLRERGFRHEAGFIAHLQNAGLGVTAIEGVGVDAVALAATQQAMEAGAEIIVQAALQSGQWVGRADVLRRVAVPSRLGGWSYEPIDTKLAKETRAAAVLQLCLYADLVSAVQGVTPENAYIVAPWTDYALQPYRIADYAAYFRRARRTLEVALEAPSHETYPDPVEHCDICRWSGQCSGRRRADDHLSLVAGATTAQIRELQARGIATTAELATLPVPLPWKPDRGSREAFERIREQARVLVEGRAAGEVIYELLDPATPEFGLRRLPEPTGGDVFLDFEGDPFVGQHGLEYLLGYACHDGDGAWRYTGHWALTRQEEREAFEGFIDFVIARLKEWPGLHIYHYAPYEPAALKRLMGRYASREEEVDRLLRNQVFVDLLAVTRRSIRASVESYSIKRLEPLYAFERQAPLEDANLALARLQASLELEDAPGVVAEDRAIVELYNRDDCVSALALRDWLEARRRELVEAGLEIGRPAPEEVKTPDNIAAWLERIAPVMTALLHGVPDDPAARDEGQQARWLLAHILDWHRREQKSAWWELFRLCDLQPEDLLEERAALGGLEFLEKVDAPGKIPTHRYRFPPQECELRPKDTLKSAGGDAFGTVAAISLDERTVDIKKRQDTAQTHVAAVFSHQTYGITEQQNAILRLAEHVVEHGLGADGPYAGARALLQRTPPANGTPVQLEGETPLAAALRMIDANFSGVLPIQGPPGTGKTFTGAQIISRLVGAGRTVGVMANSHKVIRNLLNDVIKRAEQEELELVCLHKADEPQDDLPRLRFAKDNPEVFAAINDGDAQVVGGTVWLWSRAEAFECVDVLVVDEAAQVALANVLAAAQCAPLVILLGDPQQLDQPVKGSHPEGAAVSALHHLLGGSETMPPERGLFLDETWRLSPRICDFTSEVFYEGRLSPRPGLERQVLVDAGPLTGAGLRFLPVPHEGNQNASREEADAIAKIVADLLAGGAHWIDADGARRALTLADIRILAPYNAQVFELQRRLPAGAEVGTVDKFQGQQAPLAIFSLTTSSYADAPRGMEFLYSLNRFNVATSRARCISLMVASPGVLAAGCRTPRQLQLVNAFCRFLELAQVIG